MENSFYNNLLSKEDKKTIDDKILGLYRLHRSEPQILNNEIKGFLVNFITDKLMQKTFVQPIEEIYKFL